MSTTLLMIKNLIVVVQTTGQITFKTHDLIISNISQMSLPPLDMSFSLEASVSTNRSNFKNYLTKVVYIYKYGIKGFS